MRAGVLGSSEPRTRNSMSPSSGSSNEPVRRPPTTSIAIVKLVTPLKTLVRSENWLLASSMRKAAAGRGASEAMPIASAASQIVVVVRKAHPPPRRGTRPSALTP